MKMRSRFVELVADRHFVVHGRVFTLACSLLAVRCALDVSAADFLLLEKSGKGVQTAIDRAVAAGGGRVVLEAGTYPSATLYFRSAVELHLKKGAVLLGSPNWFDYDDVDDPRIGKVPERSKKAFLVAIGCENVAITGEGIVDGHAVRRRRQLHVPRARSPVRLKGRRTPWSRDADSSGRSAQPGFWVACQCHGESDCLSYVPSGRARAGR